MLERILKERIERAQKLLPEDVDGRIVLSREVSSRSVTDPNIEYLLGSKNIAPAFALVTKDQAIGVVHEMDSGMFEAFKEVGELKSYRKYDDFLSLLKESIKDKILLADFVELTDERKAFSYLDSLTAGMKELLSRYAQLRSASDYIIKLRGVKTPAEIDALRKAASYARKIAEEIPSFIHDGMTELELASKIYSEIRLYGEPSFPVIVAFLENTANPHHHPGNKRLDRKGPILVDFGVRYESMCSDTTRMYYRGTPDEEFLIVLETVYGAKEAAEKEIRPGKKGKEIHEVAVEYLRERGYAEYFIHSLGHPLGLETHDIGVGLNPREERELEVNNVVTVEPGVYLRRPKNAFGVRLEDDVVVKEDGVEKLIHVPPTAIIV